MKAIAAQNATHTAPAKKQKTEVRAKSASQVSAQPVPVFAGALIQRKCACGGDCPRCESEQQKKKKKPRLQTKLKISTPGDQYEQEADRVAEQVMRMAEPARHSKVDFTKKLETSVQRKCAACKDEEELAQRKESHAHKAPAADDFQDASSATDEVLRSTGQSLDALTREFMESRFAYDFGNVRVHQDGAAAESARALNARAYTVGHNIVFGAGQYAPQSVEGKKLLAHELTHVIQQRPQGPAQSLVQRQEEKSESGEEPEKESEEEATTQEAAEEKKTADAKAALDGKDCKGAPKGLGFQEPQPKCTMPPPIDIGLSGRHFHFCFDSDVLAAETSANVATFVAKKREEAPDMQFLVHGYSSLGGDDLYNKRLACHRANRMSRLLMDAGVASADMTTASKGATDEFPGGPEFNQVAVVKAEIPPERRFGQLRDDPECPKMPTNLGNVEPDPACPDSHLDLGAECQSLSAGQRAAECGSFRFCLDSDIFSSPQTPGRVMAFARRQPAASQFSVQGFTSDEGSQMRAYNLRLSCHRAKRLARELMKVGVPQEQIDISGKGATAQFGDAEANRVGMVRVRPPVIGPAPEIKTPKTPQEKHAIVDMARARLDTGGYRLEADAYISFWTCGRVPTVRHAVNTTHWFVEGDEGVPKYLHFPQTTEVSSGEAGGRLGLNSAVVSDDVFFDRTQDKAGNLTDVMGAMTYLSFFDKVSDEDFGTARERGSEREQAAFHLQELVARRARTADPLKDKPAPRCQKVPPPTYKGAPAPGEVGARIPKFEVNEIDFLTSAGASQMIAPLPGNRGSLETTPDALRARAKVTAKGSPQDLRNYDVGFVMSLTQDRTNIAYRGGENVVKGLPVPMRDTDGFEAREPWFSEGSFESTKSGQVEVSMSKIMAEELALNFQPLSGKREGTAGTPLATVARSSEYQLWLVARRRGAPLDAFSTHFLNGTQVVFRQNWDATAKPPSGTFTVTASIAGSDRRLVRFTGPTPQDLGTKETTTSDVLSSCAKGFGHVDFEIDDEEATGSDDAVFLERKGMDFMGKTVPGLWLSAKPAPVNYKPLITLRPRRGKELDDRFEVGLIQNAIEIDWQNTYSTGEIVRSRCTQKLPIRDASEKQGETDTVFMSNNDKELTDISLQRKQPRLQLRDVPGGAAMLDLSVNPACPGKSSGTLTRINVNHKFRTWVAVRFAKDDTCLHFLHHIDWKTTYEATANPDRLISGKLEVLSSGNTLKPSLEGLANRDCGSDYSEPCK